jgi:hypothetical protein
MLKFYENLPRGLCGVRSIGRALGRQIIDPLDRLETPIVKDADEDHFGLPAFTEQRQDEGHGTRMIVRCRTADHHARLSQVAHDVVIGNQFLADAFEEFAAAGQLAGHILAMTLDDCAADQPIAIAFRNDSGDQEIGGEPRNIDSGIDILTARRPAIHMFFPPIFEEFFPGFHRRNLKGQMICEPNFMECLEPDTKDGSIFYVTT